MDDLRAVMDDAGSERATLFAHSEGGSLCIPFAATHPERTNHLIMTESFAKRIRSDNPWAPTAEDRSEFIAATERDWGRTDDVEHVTPSRVDDAAFRSWWLRFSTVRPVPFGAASASRNPSRNLESR